MNLSVIEDSVKFLAEETLPECPKVLMPMFRNMQITASFDIENAVLENCSKQENVKSLFVSYDNDNGIVKPDVLIVICNQLWAIHQEEENSDILNAVVHDVYSFERLEVKSFRLPIKPMYGDITYCQKDENETVLWIGLAVGCNKNTIFVRIDLNTNQVFVDSNEINKQIYSEYLRLHEFKYSGEIQYSHEFSGKSNGSFEDFHLRFIMNKEVLSKIQDCLEVCSESLPTAKYKRLDFMLEKDVQMITFTSFQIQSNAEIKPQIALMVKNKRKSRLIEFDRQNYTIRKPIRRPDGSFLIYSCFFNFFYILH